MVVCDAAMVAHLVQARMLAADAGCPAVVPNSTIFEGVIVPSLTKHGIFVWGLRASMLCQTLLLSGLPPSLHNPLAPAVRVVCVVCLRPSFCFTRRVPRLYGLSLLHTADAVWPQVLDRVSATNMGATKRV
jgi:hypothetical protein